MNYGTYNAESLRKELDAFERRYGRSSEIHYAERYGDPWRTPHGVTGFDSAVWADTYREWQRLRAIAKAA